MSFEVKFGNQPSKRDQVPLAANSGQEGGHRGRGQGGWKHRGGRHRTRASSKDTIERQDSDGACTATGEGQGQQRGRGRGNWRQRRGPKRRPGNQADNKDDSGSQDSDGASSVTSEGQSQQGGRGEVRYGGQDRRGVGGRDGQWQKDSGGPHRGSVGDMSSRDGSTSTPNEIHIHYHTTTVPERGNLGPFTSPPPQPAYYSQQPGLQPIYNSYALRPIPGATPIFRAQSPGLQSSYPHFSQQPCTLSPQHNAGQRLDRQPGGPPVNLLGPTPLMPPPLLSKPSTEVQSLSQWGPDHPKQAASSTAVGPGWGSSYSLDQESSGHTNIRPTKVEGQKKNRRPQASGDKEQMERRVAKSKDLEQHDKRGPRQNEQGPSSSKEDGVNVPELSPDEWIKIFNLLLKQFGGRTRLGTLLSQKGELFKGLSHAQAAAWLKHSNRFLTFEKDGKIKFVQINFKDARTCFKYKKHNTDKCENTLCPFFHICREFLLGACSRQPNCHFNHSFHAKNNAKVCKEVGLQGFTDEEIRMITLRSTPMVCSKFNEGGCNEDCPDLHVCIRFIQNNCSSEDCRFGHTIKGVKHNDWVLETFHMQKIQEHTLLKLVFALKDELKQGNKPPVSAEGAESTEPSVTASREGQEKNSLMRKQQSRESMVSSQLSVAESTEQEPSPSTAGMQRSKKAMASKKRKDTKTRAAEAVAADQEGQLPLQKTYHTPEQEGQSFPEKACYKPQRQGYVLGQQQQTPFVLRGSGAAAMTEGTEEQAGLPASHYTHLCEYHTWTEKCSRNYLCPRYHHRHKPPVMWQLQILGDWLDFSALDSTDIEQHFCLLKRSLIFEVVLESVGGLKVCADFEEMMCTVLDSSVSSVAPKQTLRMRRWSTPSYVEAEPSTSFTHYTQWIWYQQLDKHEKYQPLIPGTLQYTVEKKYLSGQHKYYFEMETERFLLLLQEKQLVNLNQGYAVSVLRRPHFIDSTGLPALSPLLLTEVPKQLLSVPSQWDSVDCYQDFEMYELDQANSEFRDVERAFHCSLSRERASVVHVFRVQNPAQWDKYCSMKRAMTPRGGQTEDVDERRLFHGTPSLQAARSICANTVDFRRSGENVGAKYGRGSYFSCHALYSHSYTQGPEDRLMFLARVLVGHFTKGQQHFTTPPIREGLKLFDSCVDDEANPTIFVIFDLSQSYPEYLIQYSDTQMGPQDQPGAAASVADTASRPIPVPRPRKSSAMPSSNSLIAKVQQLEQEMGASLVLGSNHGRSQAGLEQLDFRNPYSNMETSKKALSDSSKTEAISKIALKDQMENARLKANPGMKSNADKCLIS